MSWYTYDLEVYGYLEAQQCVASRAPIASAILPRGVDCVATNATLPFDVHIVVSFSGSCNTNGEIVDGARVCVGSSDCLGSCFLLGELVSGACIQFFLPERDQRSIYVQGRFDYPSI